MKIEQFFEQYSVVAQDSPEHVLTSDNFERMCQDKLIFNENSYKKFFDSSSSKGLCKSYDDLLLKWEKVKGHLKHNLKFFEEDSSLPQLLAKMDSFILNANENSDRKKIWLNYKILEFEINRLLVRSYVTNLLPDEIIKLDECIFDL